MRRLPDAISILLIILAMLSVLLPFSSSLLPLESLEFPVIEKIREFSIKDSYLNITHNFSLDFSQPPLLLWLSKFFYDITGNLLLSARLPSIIFSAFILISLYRIAGKYFDDRVGFWWILFLIATPLSFLVFKSASPIALGMVFTFLALYRLQRATFEQSVASSNFLAAAIYTGLGGLSLGFPVLVVCLGNYLLHWITERFNVKEKLNDVLMYFVLSIIIFGLWPLSIFLGGGNNLLKAWMSALFDTYHYGINLSMIFGLIILAFFPLNLFSITVRNVRSDNRMDQRHFLKWMNQYILVCLIYMWADYRVIYLLMIPMAFMAAYALIFYIRDTFYWPTAVNSLVVFIGGGLVTFFIILAWLPSFKNEFSVYLNSAYIGAFLRQTDAGNMGKILAVTLGAVLFISAYMMMKKQIYNATVLLLVAMMVFNGAFIGTTILPLKESMDTPLIRFFTTDKTPQSKYYYYQVNRDKLLFYSGSKTPINHCFDIIPGKREQYIIANINDEKRIDVYFKSFKKLYKEGGYIFYEYVGGKR